MQSKNDVFPTGSVDGIVKMNHFVYFIDSLLRNKCPPTRKHKITILYFYCSVVQLTSYCSFN